MNGVVLLTIGLLFMAIAIAVTRAIARRPTRSWVLTVARWTGLAGTIALIIGFAQKFGPASAVFVLTVNLVALHLPRLVWLASTQEGVTPTSWEKGSTFLLYLPKGGPKRGKAA